MKSILFLIFLTFNVCAWSQADGPRSMSESVRTMRVQRIPLTPSANSALRDSQNIDKTMLEFIRRKQDNEMPTTGGGGTGTGSGGGTGGGTGGTGSGKVVSKNP